MASQPKADPTPATANNDNLRLWNKLGKTDPRHTKGFSRGGGFKGTAVKPMWQNKQLTETFGPCGLGWGFEKPEFQLVDGHGTEKLVYCTVSAWYVPDPAKPDEIAHVYGVGGDKVIAQFSSKVANDDEAFKKAFTDAIGNAFKFIGVAADVHMGMFDDSKYVQDLEAEFIAAEDTLGVETDTMLDRIRTCDDVEALRAMHEEVKDLLAKLKEANRAGEHQMLTSTYKARGAKLAPPKKDEAPAKETEPAPAK